MALIRWQPRKTEPIESCREEVERLFEDFCSRWGRARTAWPASSRARALAAEGEGIFSKVELLETDRDFIVRAEVRGVPKEDIEVTVGESSVTLKGQRAQERETRGERSYTWASTYGSFQRVIPLPGEALAHEAKAELKEGVLTVTIPKARPSALEAFRLRVE
jgi:HSP20 family protein